MSSKLGSCAGGVLSGFAILAASTLAQPARAQDANADQLFEKGKALLQEQGADLVKACEYLAESDRLAPAVGTLGLLANCHERRNLIATAWREYLEAADRAAQTSDPRGAFAKERAAELEPRVPRLIVTVETPPSGLVVERDGKAIPASELGQDVAIDPGPVVVVARAPNRRDLRVRVVAREWSRTYVHIPELSPGEHPPTQARAAAPAPRQGETAQNPLRLPLVIGASAIGVAGIVVGATFGGLASGKNDASKQIQETCGKSPESCARGRDLREESQRDALVSTIGFGAGLVGIGAAVLAFVVTPPKPAPVRSGVWIGPTAGLGGALGGRF